MDALVCASLFVGCKQKGTPKPLEDFRRFADEKQIKNCIALLSDEMGININASKPIAFIQEIAEKGCISDEARVKAYKILNALKNVQGFKPRDPRGFAAAALYLACKASGSNYDTIQTQRDLAVFAGLTEVTVRSRIRDIESVATIIMPK